MTGLYFVRRLFWAIPVMLIVVTIVFIVSRVLPGNPVYLMAGTNPTPEKIARITRELGLDKPVLVQLKMYLLDLLHGDLGIAWHTGNPVIKDILSRAPATIELALAALAFTLLIGLPLGIIAAAFKDSLLDSFLASTSLIGFSMPSFWLGLLLIYCLCYQFKIFPMPMGRISMDVALPKHITGLYVVDSLLTGNVEALVSSIQHLMLPAFTLALGQIAGLSRMIRRSLVEVLESDYIRTAKAYGFSEAAILCKHALKNALIPAITYMADSVLWLMGGEVVIEVVFTWPGLGLYATNCILMKDYAGLQGTVLLIAMMSVFVYLVMDFLYTLVDPRVKY